MGAQWNQRGKPQYAGPHLRFSGCAGRCFVRLSLLPFCQTASAFRLICLFHTFCRRGVYRAMVFAPLRCPNLFRFPFACLRAALSNCFAHRLYQHIIRIADIWKRRKKEARICRMDRQTGTSFCGFGGWGGMSRNAKCGHTPTKRGFPKGTPLAHDFACKV